MNGGVDLNGDFQFGQSSGLLPGGRHEHRQNAVRLPLRCCLLRALLRPAAPGRDLPMSLTPHSGRSSFLRFSAMAAIGIAHRHPVPAISGLWRRSSIEVIRPARLL